MKKIRYFLFAALMSFIQINAVTQDDLTKTFQDTMGVSVSVDTFVSNFWAKYEANPADLAPFFSALESNFSIQLPQAVKDGKIPDTTKPQFQDISKFVQYITMLQNSSQPNPAA